MTWLLPLGTSSPESKAPDTTMVQVVSDNFVCPGWLLSEIKQ